HPGGRGVDRIDVGADVLAVGSGALVGARGRQAVVAAGQIHEADIRERGGKEVVGWIDERVTAGLDVTTIDESGEKGVEGEDTRPRAAADDPLMLGGDVVAEGEAGRRRLVGTNREAILEGRVVVDRDIGGAIENLE